MWFSHKFTSSYVLLIYFLLGLYIERVNAFQQRKRENFAQLAEKYNLQYEEYDVTTEDGYILKLFHIKGNSSRPVMLWHGTLDSADTYLLRGPVSTGFELVQAGYDVWLGNSRGNIYSRRHKTLDPDKDKKKFWDFTFHEMGYYDLPATIDFVLDKTGQKQVSAIGHSRATAIFYVLGSTRPEYNEKVKILVSLAPIAYLNHIRGLFRDLLPLLPLLLTLFQGELFGEDSIEKNIFNKVCTGMMGYELCLVNTLMPLLGNDTEELEPEFFSEVIKHSPVATSSKDFTHFVQIVNRKQFANYDYGFVINLVKYGKLSPPKYDLSKVKMPVALLCGMNDNLATIQDVDQLRRELPNVVYYKLMDRKEFNHIDFIWGKNMNVYLNPLIKDLLK